jgi:hypothetical protein
MPTTLTIVPWVDPIVDTIGHDPRSRYAETFWLPALGPTSLLLLRHLADRFDESFGARHGIQVGVADTSRALGVGTGDGHQSPIVRTLARLEQFDLATDAGSNTVAVRRNLPPLARRQLQRLPLSLQALHREWMAARLNEPPHAEARQRARRLALRLVEQGDDPDCVERALGAVGYHPAVSAEAARWAVEQRERDDDLTDASRPPGVVAPLPTR